MDGAEKIKTIALIPIRSGSKGIKNKNIKPMCGKPLFYWATKAALSSKVVDDVYLSTDSEKYVEIVRTYFPNIKTLMRSKRLASDRTSTEDVIVDFMKHVYFDVLITIQATNPMLQAIDITNAYKHMIDNNYASIVSTVKMNRFAWPEWETDRKTGAWPINYDPFHRPRRQETMQPIHIENGSFYITSRWILEKEVKCRLGGKIGLYAMPEDTIYELDEPDDWEIVERLLSIRINNV